MSDSKRISKTRLKLILPIAVLVASVVLLGVLSKLRPEVEKKEPVPNYPKIEVFTVRDEPVQIVIEAQGTVEPRQQTRLTSRVSGLIEWVSPNFYSGGSFSAGETLLKIDPLPYQSALAEAQSRLALAESVYLQEQEASEQAKLDWGTVGSGEPSPLVLRIPQLEKAAADLEAARVGEEMARKNLSYTEVRAPYTGRVQSKLVDVGQAISAQVTILGEVFSTDAMEVPLAITLDELALIPQIINSEARPARVDVRLSANIAGTRHQWNAKLDRTAASVDARTRMISAYATVDPPFMSDYKTNLKPGMFVSAYIQGKDVDNAVRIPRGAIQPGNIVYRLNEDQRLESVNVEIIRTDAQWAVITEGLKPGDQLCLTPLLFFVDGMKVEPAIAEPAAEAES